MQPDHSGSGHMLRPENRLELYEILSLRNKICVEVGVFDGGNAKQILACEPANLYLIDIWQHQPAHGLHWANPLDSDFELIFQRVNEEFGCDQRIQIIRCDSCLASTRFRSGFFDFVYIDTVHERDQCLAELNAWYDKIAPGGWLNAA